MVEKPQSWDLWAHEIKDRFWHIGTKHWVELHLLADPVVPVTVTVDPNGSYYGWLDNKDDTPSMVWPAEILFEMCFPSGSKPYVDAGRGRAVRLIIQKRDCHE